jgi:hypothetical protein
MREQYGLSSSLGFAALLIFGNMVSPAKALNFVYVGSSDSQSVALPGDVDLKIRAARMNEFWRALVAFQHRDVRVVAMCVGD